MGLDISHNTWHGAYSAFMTWRKKIAEVAGLPPLELMEGFYTPLISTHSISTFYANGYEKESYSLKELDKRLPIKWNSLKPNPLHELLYHSDCDGYIAWSKCKKISAELRKLLVLLPNKDAGGHIGNWIEKTTIFIDGLNLAYSKKERLKFR